MWLQEIFAGGVEGILKGVKDVMGAFKADPLEVLKLQSAINDAEIKMTVAFTEAQNRVNAIEAASQDKYVTRWRPSVGWICVIGLGYATIFQPLATWVCLNLQTLPPPQLDITILMPLVTGLLGLAGYRTYEKTHNGKL